MLYLPSNLHVIGMANTLFFKKFNINFAESTYKFDKNYDIFERLQRVNFLPSKVFQNVSGGLVW